MIQRQALRAFAMLALSCGATWGWAATQVVTVQPSSLQAAPGAEVRCALQYSVVDGPAAARLSGVGVRLHFDSRRLKFLGFESVLGQGLLGQDEQPAADLKNADRDPGTDKFVQAAWVDVSGDWPRGIALPAQLLTARFLVVGKSAGTTYVRVSSSGTAAGAGFRGTAAQVNVR